VYVLELGSIKMEGPAKDIMENTDVKNSYLGIKADK
jgi:ABC-type lipopolysaccharide export system ATPase subunit